MRDKQTGYQRPAHVMLGVNLRGEEEKPGL